jgi:hypothetical protein
MAPTLGRYFDLIVDSAKTPEAVEESALDSALSSIFRAVKAATAYIKSLWGEEYFPPEPTSRENEMSVVQSAVLNGHRVMLTGDAGREALQEVIDYAPLPDSRCQAFGISGTSSWRAAQCLDRNSGSTGWFTIGQYAGQAYLECHLQFCQSR